MATAEGLISLSERLRQHAQRIRRRGPNAFAVDLRYAAYAARRLAALLVADEAAAARGTPDEVRLACEAAALWREAAHDR